MLYSFKDSGVVFVARAVNTAVHIHVPGAFECCSPTFARCGM